MCRGLLGLGGGIYSTKCHSSSDMRPQCRQMNVKQCMYPPPSSWRKPCLSVTSRSRPDAVVRSSPAPAVQLLPEDRPENKKTQPLTHKINAWSQRKSWGPHSSFVLIKLLEFLSKYLQVFTALHEVLHVINDRKVQAKNLEKVHLLLRQVRVGQKLDQVAKVIAAATHTNTRTHFNNVLQTHTAEGFKRFSRLTKIINDSLTGSFSYGRPRHMERQITTHRSDITFTTTSINSG